MANYVPSTPEDVGAAPLIHAEQHEEGGIDPITLTIGPTGPTGAASSVTGPPGPNVVSNETSTDIEGLIKGTSGSVTLATPSVDYVAPVDLDSYLPKDMGGQVGFEGIFAMSSGGSGTVNMPENTALFHEINGDLVRHYIPANLTLALTDLVTNYICADRDTDTWVALTDIDDVDYERYLLYGEIYRSGNSIHVQLSPIPAQSFSEKLYRRINRADRYIRESGLEGLAVDISGNITLDEGYVWTGLERMHIVAVTTSTIWFHDHVDAGVWHNEYHASNPVVQNTYYNNSEDLIPLTSGWWTINYIFRGVETQDHMYIVLGVGQWATWEEADENKILPALPDLITSHTLLVGRILVQEGDVTTAICETAFSEFFSRPSERGPTGPKGDNGSNGDTGPQGPKGTIWFNGVGVPADIIGATVGDYYLDTSTGDIYILD